MFIRKCAISTFLHITYPGQLQNASQIWRSSSQCKINSQACSQWIQLHKCQRTSQRLSRTQPWQAQSNTLEKNIMQHCGNYCPSSIRLWNNHNQPPLRNLWGCNRHLHQHSVGGGGGGGGSQQPTTIVPPYTALRQRLNINTKIAMTPGHAKRQPPQTEPHIIPYDTEVLPPYTHQYYFIPFNVPLLHIYNNRAGRLKGHNLMEYHVSKIMLSRQIPTPAPTNTTVHQTGEEWVHTNSTTGNVTIQPGLINSGIWP